MDALKAISPLKRDKAHDHRVEAALRMLENYDLIEIVDQSNANNFTCRFNKMFLRETLYQVMRYKPVKRDLHKAVETYIQSKQGRISFGQHFDRTQ